MKKGIDRKELENLLATYKSVAKVATFLGRPYSTVYTWCKKYDLDLLPSCMNMYDKLRSHSLTDTHKSILLGSILGDGSLIKAKGAKNARLQIGHCTKQLGYLEWKFDLLTPFSTKITLAERPGPKVICGVDSYSTGYYIMNTIVHPDITYYYDKYYMDGKKRVVPDVIDELDWLSLAVWLADDGSFSFHGSKTALRGSIATCSFCKHELEILITALKRFFGGTIGIDSSNNCIVLGKTFYVNELLDKITSILPESIHYKLVPQRLCVKPL